MYGRAIGIILAATLALTGCASSENDAAAGRRAEAEVDASASLACDHWRNVASDISKGLLTDAELREKVKEVYDSAWVSEEPGIASGAEALLRAVTMNDGDALLAAMGQFTTACVESGAFE